MKIFLFLIGLVAACMLGYSFEPNLRLSLTGIAPEKKGAQPTAVAEVKAEPKPTPVVPPTPEPAPVVTPPPAPEIPVVPTPTPEPTPPPTPEPVEPAPAPEPTPEPAPVPAPEPPASPVAAGDVVAIMQASIKGGEIKEFAFDQVLDWEAAAEPETIDGTAYQTGIASYKAETVFGVKTIQAKALVKDGKVVRWFWPKSGMDIK